MLDDSEPGDALVRDRLVFDLASHIAKGLS